MCLENKCALVTAGGSGLARGLATRYPKEGSKALIVGRTEKSLLETKADPKHIAIYAGDITNYLNNE